MVYYIFKKENEINNNGIQSKQMHIEVGHGKVKQRLYIKIIKQYKKESE